MPIAYCLLPYCKSVNPVYNLYMQISHANNDMFNGKWVIRYDPYESNYQAVMETLTEMHGNQGADDIPALDLMGPQKIKKIHLLYPALLGDKRWKTLHLTAASLFIGSSLANAPFDVKAQKQILPAVSIDPEILNCDLIGFTLFEDLFSHTKEFLARLRDQYKYNGLIAAGGPLITLNPLESAFHLPEINLFVRGEAEFILPGLLRAIETNDISRLLKFKGFLFQIPGTIVISDFNEINRPEDFAGFRFNLDFPDKHHFEEGLEINVSRGCKRGCIFCSAVQGKAFRTLPIPQLEDLLNRFSGKLAFFHVRSPHGKTVNINDDDILQDPDYANAVFKAIKRCGFRLWGIQTSISSFFDPEGRLNQKNLDLIDDPSLYLDNNPLVWSGTDAFLKERGKKLGKVIPSEQQMLELLEELEKRKIRSYHYWISSDYRSDWEEFSRELMIIYRLQSRFTYFGLIAHSPFLVPYSTTPLYRLLIRSDQLKNQIKYKKILESKKEVFTFPLVERVETPYMSLNRLLNNEKLSNRQGFFDDLNRKDYVNAFITLYNFLKQERIDMESLNRNREALQLKQIENNVETFISEIIDK
jgi:hypothetical protein